MLLPRYNRASGVGPGEQKWPISVAYATGLFSARADKATVCLGLLHLCQIESLPYLLRRELLVYRTIMLDGKGARFF